MKKKLNRDQIKNASTYILVTVAFIILQLLSAQGKLNSTTKGFLVPACAYIVLAVSLNLLVGICGELSLGHAGFMGIGAFSSVADLRKFVLDDDYAGRKELRGWLKDRTGIYGEDLS